LYIYELFDLWSSPWWTAWLIVAYFLSVLLAEGFFKHASFCKFVCPLDSLILWPRLCRHQGQGAGLGSLQLSYRCHTVDCDLKVQIEVQPASGRLPEVLTMPSATTLAGR
jgi:hypothetical protein